MTYNKKQMQPLIDKYQINPETNKLFISVLEMFDGQTNYQNWAVKMIFSQAMTFGELERIKAWIDENQSSIVKLSKKNIVSYSSKTAIYNLFKEIRGLEKLNLIKDVISHFNTDQRKLLTQELLPENITPAAADNSAKIQEWFDIFSAFNKKPMTRKNKFYSTCSAVRDINVLTKLIRQCLEETYSWDKEDFLSFLAHNAKDCRIVFDSGNIVVVEIPSYESSHKLCGSGRTEWCLARESGYFKRYVTDYDNRRQFFFFDFGRKECDAFAHIGFTVEGGKGLVEAQTTNNYSMLRQKYQQGKEALDINDIFTNFGIKMSNFMVLHSDFENNWNVQTFLEMADKKPNNMSVVYNKNNRLILKVTDTQTFRMLVKGTFIHADNFIQSDDSEYYVFLDFNIKFNEDRCMIAMLYRKDTYGTLSLAKMQDCFGADITKDGYLPKLGISSDEFVKRKKIDPSILLHKYIDENDEKAAIELIENEGGNINVNYEFNQRVPVFVAINNKMFGLFEKIVNHPQFDSRNEDGFGETLLESLIYLHGTDEVDSSKDESHILENMIRIILNSKTFDFNVRDLNNDTPINIACEYPSQLWILKALVSRKDVDVNVVNDFKSAALGSCIRNNNIEALKLIGQRPDLVVTEEDRKLAKTFKINLDDYIKPDPSIFGRYSSNEAADSLEEEFAKAAMA